MRGVAEDHLVQVGQSFASTVVTGAAHQGVMPAGYALRHHERAARDLGVQVVGRLLDGLGRHRAEMVRGQGREEAIHPILEERSIGLFEVEGDRQVVRQDVCRANHLQADRSISHIGAELGIEPELASVVDVARIVGLPIRPHQAWSQMERPGLGVGADAPILHGGHLSRCTRMHHTLRITIEERQEERLVERSSWVESRAIRNECIWIDTPDLSPGASMYWGRGAAV